MEAWNRKCDR